MHAGDCVGTEVDRYWRIFMVQGVDDFIFALHSCSLKAMVSDLTQNCHILVRKMTFPGDKMVSGRMQEYVAA
jgi:hypothetical protein